VKSPLVSVVLPTRDREHLVGGAVESILAQTLGDLELLVVDDGSTDDTQEVLASHARGDQRVRVLRVGTPGGCNAARNHALSQVRGRYVAMLDDDDLALPQRLEKTVARFGAEPALGAVFSRCRFMDGHGNPYDWEPRGFPIGAGTADGDRMFELLYCDWAWIPTCTLTLRADLVSRHRYPDIRRSDGDSIFHCTLAAGGTSFAQIDEPLALVRRDDSHDSMSRDRARLLAARRESLAYLRQWVEERGIKRFDHLHSRAWSNQLVREAEHFQGMRGLWRAISALAYWPRNPGARAYLRAHLPARLAARLPRFERKAAR
jgi:glycosyltransferase involved in cell wall biosynthesis